MNRRMRWGAAVALFVLVLVAGLLFDELIVVRHPDRNRLAGLVVATAPTGFAPKPATSTVIDASSIPVDGVKALVQKDPSQTGAWTTTWDASKATATNDSASVIVTYLPSSADAASTEKQAVTQFLGANSFQSESYALVGPLTVPGVPGAKAAEFKPTGSATTPPVTAVVYSYGRAQVLVIVGQTGNPSVSGASAAALAGSEYTRLEQALPGFRMGQVTEVPFVASLLYWGILGAVVALVVLIPLGIRRRRRRKAEARRRVALQQHQLRGSKIARRQATRRR